MFVASVLAFTTGLYLGTLQHQSIAIASIGIPLVILLVILPRLIRSRFRRISVFVLLAAFFLTGLFRVSLTLRDNIKIPESTAAVYHGTVLESSRTAKVIRINSPPYLNGANAIVRSEQAAGIGDTVSAAGKLKEISFNFKNPGSISWKWIKRQEGTLYEIQGDIVLRRKNPGVVERIRRYCAERIDASMAAHSDVIKALTIGDTTALADSTKDLFLKTGTTHILSISGSHLSVITAVIFFLAGFALRLNPRLRQKGTDRRYAAIVTIPLVITFMFISGCSLPVIRATIMVVVYLFAVIFDRTRHIENGLFLSALAILTIYPSSLFSPSFQLTFISVLFIILANKTYGRKLARFPRPFRWLASMALVTITATVGTLPVVLYHFYGFNPLSMVHNLIAVPLMCAIATPLSLAGLLLPFGDHLLRVSGTVIECTIFILGRINWGYIYPIMRPSFGEAVVYLVTAVSIVHISRRPVRLAFFVLILPAALVTTGMACQNRFDNKEMCVNYIDVGLGDAMLIEAPHGVRLLIDGGGFYGSSFDIGKSVLAPFLLAKKISTLDYVINTHPHQDHVAGLQHILQYFHVRNYATAMASPQPDNIRNIVNVKRIPHEDMQRGDRLRIGTDIDMHVLHSYAGPDRVNDSSLVLRLAYGRHTFLFTGDIGQDTERLLVMHTDDLRSNVLKIPHHGSRHSNSVHFIRAVKPDIAVMSVGPGIRGIPSEEAIARFQELGIPVYRTDRHGCVRVCTDGDRLSVHTENP